MSFPPGLQQFDALPRVSMMSISPLAGHGPGALTTGSIQIAGQSQSPLGTLASTSTWLNRPAAPEFGVDAPRFDWVNNAASAGVGDSHAVTQHI